MDTDQNNIPPQIQELQMQFETWDKVITQVTSTPATPKQLQKTKTIMTELNSTVNVIRNAQRSTENKKNDINFDILNKSLLTKINTFPEINKQINQIHEKNQPQPPNLKTYTNPKTQAEKPKTNTKNPITNAAKLQDIIHIDPQTPKKQNPKDRKTYKCAICKRQFTQPYSLKRHIKTIHNKDRGEKDKPQNMSPKKLHQCTICQTKFTESFSLDRHKRQLHKKTIIKPTPRQPESPSGRTRMLHMSENIHLS